MSLIERILAAVSTGVGDRAGCNDGDEDRAMRWVEASKSEEAAVHDRLIREVHDAVGSGD